MKISCHNTWVRKATKVNLKNYCRYCAIKHGLEKAKTVNFKTIEAQLCKGRKYVLIETPLEFHEKSRGWELSQKCRECGIIWWFKEKVAKRDIYQTSEWSLKISLFIMKHHDIKRFVRPFSRSDEEYSLSYKAISQQSRLFLAYLEP